jgi:hypothetical protein
MSVCEFRDDDDGYLAWLAGNPDGYVVNILRSHRATGARLHRADCRWISGENPSGGVWTGPYVKVCAAQLADLELWTIETAGQPIRSCGTCGATSDAIQPVPTKHTQRVTASVAPTGRCHIHGPTTGSPIVEAWADDYIRFERRPPWQEQLRAQIRARSAQLQPSAGEVLHATFFGEKLANADVENLILYCIDSFAAAGSNGIRFEHGATVPSAPDGCDYRYCYRYALALRSTSFASWRQGSTLAAFDWTDLGAFAGYKKLEKVWWALGPKQVELFERPTAHTPFAVKVEVRPPLGCRPVFGNLLKGIFDGVICAVQANADTAVLPEVVKRLATILPVDPSDIQARLLDRRRAVLGVVPRLVSPYRNGVKWDPADHLCVAGELLAAEPVDQRWAIRGELVEVVRR